MTTQCPNPPSLAAASSAPEDLRRCREHLNNLRECFRVSGLINSTLELDEILQTIMTTSRAILKAESCSLMLVDEATEELVFAVAQGPVAHHLTESFRLRKGEGIAGCVFQSGEALLIEDAYNDPRFYRKFDEKTGYRTRSVLCMPLKVQDKVIGVSQLINRLDGAPFDARDAETLSLLCTHAAIAIDKARLHKALLLRQRMESDLAFANAIQLSFLPQDVPALEGYRFRAHYQAAHEVGGDLYDFIPLEGDRLGILIGDVSGKGVASALFMARVTSDLRLLAIRRRDPASLMEHINDRICTQSQRGMFVTLLYMVLDPGERTLTCINAGHVPPVLWNHARDRYETVMGAGGPPVGILSGRTYESSPIALEQGDCLLLATDGLLETRNLQGELFGLKRLEAAVRSGSSDVDAVFERVIGAVVNFAGGAPPADDTTLVLLGVE